MASGALRGDSDVSVLVNDERFCLDGLVSETQRRVWEVLRKHGVGTVRQLNQSLVDPKLSIHLHQAGWDVLRVLEALKVINLTPEGELAGRILGDQRPEIILVEQGYKPQCVSAALRHSGSLRRQVKIMFVLGPSGSGKTFFAMKGAPFFFKFDPRHTNRCVTVYWQLASTSDLEQVKEFVERQLQLVSASFTPTTMLRMRLCVILDEALEKSDDLKTMDQLRRLKASLDGLAEDVWLIIVGTGYDVVTAGISSVTDVFKFDLKPWKKQHFLPLALSVFEADHININPNDRCDAIFAYPTLAALTTNARSAQKLLDALTSTPWCNSLNEDFREDLRHYVSFLVERVAFWYIQENGLKRCTPKDRAQIARAIFIALECEKKNSQAHFPNLEILRTEDRISHKEAKALSLLNVHVENRNGFLERVEGETCSYSVTPSITVLLFVMVGVKGDMLDDWSNFESIAALHLFRRLIMEANDDKLHEVKLLRLKKPYPATNASVNVMVPKVSKNTIWVNGPMAPFADVVGHKELFQVKYTNGRDGVSVDLAEELCKLGLIKASTADQIRSDKSKPLSAGRLEVSNVMISALNSMWQEYATTTTTAAIGSSSIAAGRREPAAATGPRKRQFSPVKPSSSISAASLADTSAVSTKWKRNRTMSGAADGEGESYLVNCKDQVDAMQSETDAHLRSWNLSGDYKYDRDYGGCDFESSRFAGGRDGGGEALEDRRYRHLYPKILLLGGTANQDDCVSAHCSRRDGTWTMDGTEMPLCDEAVEPMRVVFITNAPCMTFTFWRREEEGRKFMKKSFQVMSRDVDGDGVLGAGKELSSFLKCCTKQGVTFFFRFDW